LLQSGDAFGDRGVGVKKAVEPAFVMLERVVYAHGSCGMVELCEGLVVGLELLQGADQPHRVTGQPDAAYIG
jgi:hypothetical protein